MLRAGASAIECDCIGTVVHIAVNGEYAGHILISDVIKPTAGDAIKALAKAGVSRIVMLTGDIKKAADKVADSLGIKEVHSDLLPSDKVIKVEEILASKKRNEKLAFVGDGINDAPVLSRADIGIAMGALGSDAAIEAADVVLMDDDPLKIAKAIKIARKCMGIVYQNIYFALGIKGICLILGALGIANMWLAIFADVGVMVIAVLNAIRALRVKNLYEVDIMDKKFEMCDETELYDLAELFKVFGDSTRIRILFVLFEEELCVCDLAQALNMTQSAISHQLKILKQSKLVKSRREGKSIFYSLADEHVKTIIAQGREHIEE